jgi:hypothetical protein
MTSQGQSVNLLEGNPNPNGKNSSFTAFEESGPVVGLGLGGAAPQRAAAKNGDF